MNWIISNWETVAVVAAFTISEILPFVKNKKANGILHFIMLFLAKGKNIENPK